MSRLGRALTLTGTIGAGLLTTHTLVNLRRLRVPALDPGPLTEHVSILLPLRDEAHRVEPCLRALLAVLDAGNSRAELVVLDDGSTDGTADVVRRIVGSDPRVRLITGRALPDGWLGKPHACQQLADTADVASTVLAFVDADVVLEPHAMASAVDLLRRIGLDLVCPYPRQLAGSPGERLVQPLLQWSWLTTLPLSIAERSPRPSLSAGNGQFLVVDRAVYQSIGGHRAVRSEVIDDVALVRAVKAAGGSGGVVDGTELATCRMYDGWAELQAGYTKSLWAAFGSPAGAGATGAALGLIYVVPALAALTRRSRVGLAGYVLAVAGRVVVARRTGGRAWPDSLAHPVSIIALTALTARSWLDRRAGRLSWKGRALP
jgi:hypothetical protein